MIKSVLIDKRTPREVMQAVLDELATASVWGFDIETQDEARHEGLNVYNNGNRHVFDHRRTVITGFSTYVEGSDTAYYFNMAQADVENRLPPLFYKLVFEAVNKDAICVAHNAPFEIVMVEQCYDGQQINNLVCTLQMAVSHHGPDEYAIEDFYKTPIPSQFIPFVKPIIDAWASFEPGDRPNGPQQELLQKFVSKTSTSKHSWNGMVDSMSIGYNLKKLTKSVFGYDQMPYKTLLDKYGATHMGQLTGEQVCEYGADDAYWAVKHYRHMFDDMLKNDPKSLTAFFQTENPMIHLYADAWREGIRLDLAQVFQRRDVERVEMAALLRRLKPLIRKALPFPTDQHKVLTERDKSWYPKGWQKKRAAIEAWVNTPDSDNDFEQCYQVSNPIGNAWALEKGKKNPAGKLNLGYWQTMRSIMYDLLRLPMQYSEGKVGSDSDARGRIREKLEKGSLQDKIMTEVQEMADIEQRMKLYLTPYTQLMDPETSRVYPSLSSQLATRRLATSFPNPMQLAKQGTSAYIRSFYLGDDDDSVVVSADWSAVELVLIGDMSDGASFRSIYGQIPYGDMHSGSAVDALSVKTMLGITEEEFREFKFGRNPNGRNLIDFSGRTLTPKDFHKWARGTAIGKGINFGYWYSGAVSTVASNLGLSDSQHWELVDKYRSRHPDEERWRVGVQDDAARDGYITLPDGHRRTRFEVTSQFKPALIDKFADISATPALLHYAETAAKRITSRGKNQVVNAMIQGTCATLAKRSLLNLKKMVTAAGMVWGVDVRLMMPIHDELVFSVKKHVLLAFIPLLREAMAHHPDIVKNLPLNCTVAMGKTFRPFDANNPHMSQIELDEAQEIPGIVPKDLEGSKLSDDKVAELLDWMFSR